MGDVGTHSKPVNGVVTNGHAPTLAPFAVPQMEIRQGGPVTPWPQPAKPSRWRHVTSAARTASAHRGLLAAIPVMLVNAVAIIAQLAFLRGHLSWAPAGQALVAVTLESVAVYLAWQAHLAIIADDSAMRLRLAAYGFAAIVGIMNYSHYMAPGWRPTFPALVFALCSVISPWLWSIHSRRQSRDALKARGLIEPHAVRLGVTRWMWHPWRSAKVMFHATWIGENDPAKAIALAEASTADDAHDDGSEAVISTPAMTPEAPPQDRHETVSEAPAEPSPRPSRQPPKRTSGRDRAAAVIKKDGTLTDAEVAKRAKVSESTARRARALAS